MDQSLFSEHASEGRRSSAVQTSRGPPTAEKLDELRDQHEHLRLSAFICGCM